MPMTNPSRRQFLFVFGAGAAALGVAACGGGGGGNDAGSSGDLATANVDLTTGPVDLTPPSCNVVSPTIGGNHGHMFAVVENDVTAAVDKTYTFSAAGVGPHQHTVTVTAAMFGDLADGKTVQTTSSTTSSHSHPVSIRCTG